MLRYSIIVPVLHESERINRLIDHLYSLGPRGACEIIVVDGSPERDTIDAIRTEQVVKEHRAEVAARDTDGTFVRRLHDALRASVGDTGRPGRGIVRITTCHDRLKTSLRGFHERRQRRDLDRGVDERAGTAVDVRELVRSERHARDREIDILLDEILPA